MFLYPCLLITTFTIVLSTTAIQRASQFQASLVSLYNSSTSMPNQSFIRTFSANFTSTPTFAFGINNYKLGDQFYYQNFDSNTNALNSTAFSIQVVSISSTNVKTFSISYIASTLSYFSVDFHSFTNAANISSGSGNRYLLIYYSKSFPSTNVLTLPLLTSYYISSSTYFMVNVTTTVISNFNYELRIETVSDCLLNRVSVYVFFAQTDQLTANGYYYQGGQKVVYSNDVNNGSFTFDVTHYGGADFLLGLGGFNGFSVLSGCYWGWQVSNVTNTTATLLIYKNQLQDIYFSFLQIGQITTIVDPVTPVTPVDPVTPTVAQGSSSIGIIAGLIAGIVLVTVGIILFLKYYCRKVRYDPPKNDFFKQMPSLTL